MTRDPTAGLSEGVVRALMARAWPGNARELKALLTNLHGLFGTAVEPKHLDAVWRLQAGAVGGPWPTDA